MVPDTSFIRVQLHEINGNENRDLVHAAGKVFDEWIVVVSLFETAQRETGLGLCDLD